MQLAKDWTGDMKLTSANKRHVRLAINALGYDIQKSHSPELGRDPFVDITKLTGSQSGLVVFDVGANVGQSIESFRNSLFLPEIHAFEPNRDIFGDLENKFAGTPGVHLNNFGLGASSGAREFIVNTTSEMSSFLEPGTDWWGEIKRRDQVGMKTIDEYALERGLTGIDILKSDTQGFDFEVLKGATRLLEEHKVHLIYFEIIFSDMYEKLPRFDEVYAFLADRGFVLVTFYKCYYQNNRLSWTDALFIDPRFKRSDLSKCPSRNRELFSATGCGHRDDASFTRRPRPA